MPSIHQWRAALIAGLLIMSASGSGSAQSGEPKAEAEAALSAFWAAREAREWDAAAGFIHPDIVTAIYERALFEARSRARSEKRRKEPPQPTYPDDMPPEVVAWFEKQREGVVEVQRDVVFPEPPPLPEIEGLTPLQYVALELKMLDPRENPGARFEERQFITVDVYNAAAFQEADRRVIGSVPADDSLVHVLYRMDRPTRIGDPFGAPTEPFALGTASLKRTPEGWRIWSGAADLIGSLGSGVAFMLAHDIDPEQVEADLRRRAREKEAGLAAEAIVRELFTAIDDKRWADAAALVDPETLDRFKTHNVRQERQRQDAVTGERRYSPDTPPEVVAWYEQQRASAPRVDPADLLSRQFAGVRSLQELEALPAVEVLARHLQAVDPREQAHREAADHGVALPAEIAVRTERLLNPNRSVLGHAVESDSLVQVVYRANWAPDPMDRLAMAATVRRTEAGWRLWHAPEDPSIFMTSGWFGMMMYAGAAFFLADEEAEFRSAAEMVAEWTAPNGARMRAFVTGYTGGSEPPEALTIETAQPDGTITRLDVPNAHFPTLMRMIAGWPEPQD